MSFILSTYSGLASTKGFDPVVIREISVKLLSRHNSKLKTMENYQNFRQIVLRQFLDLENRNFHGKVLHAGQSKFTFPNIKTKKFRQIVFKHENSLTKMLK